VMWLVLHLIYITGFKSRVTALVHWGVSFVGRDNSERTTTDRQTFGRVLPPEAGEVSPPG